jgi:hypothetical protein
MPLMMGDVRATRAAANLAKNAHDDEVDFETRDITGYSYVSYVLPPESAASAMNSHPERNSRTVYLGK